MEKSWVSNHSKIALLPIKMIGSRDLALPTVAITLELSHRWTDLQRHHTRPRETDVSRTINDMRWFTVGRPLEGHSSKALLHPRITLRLAELNHQH
jgi:hypothetical protein